MTKEEILAMKAGRELNIRVAEEVMGCRVVQDGAVGDTEDYNLSGEEKPPSRSINNRIYGPLRRYSEDMAAAKQVVDKLEDYTLRVEFNHYKEEWEVEFVGSEASSRHPVVGRRRHGGRHVDLHL